jgi:hypothetical protein
MEIDKATLNQKIQDLLYDLGQIQSSGKDVRERTEACYKLFPSLCREYSKCNGLSLDEFEPNIILCQDKIRLRKYKYAIDIMHSNLGAMLHS